jgi:pimeloyl-ACP methyl ester carboxylesterase
MLAAQLPLVHALTGQRQTISASAAGGLSYYRSNSDDPRAATGDTPLLLVHSINAAGSAYEVLPLYENYRFGRPVYALELPGFGFSERSDRVYSARLMTDAIHAMVDVIRKSHSGKRIDALALSLSSEFLARAISEQPDSYRSAALVSPTGFDSKAPYREAPGTTRAKPRLYAFLRFTLWSRAIFRLLTSRRSIRYFLERTWGSKTIDEELLDYDYLTTHQLGARFAPYYFVSGYLFSGDITCIYEQLALPIWLVHGDRGDFQDYKYASEFKKRPNWTVTELATGALPYFEKPQEFIQLYDEFLARTGL